MTRLALAAPGSTLWLLRHDLRLIGRDFRAAGKGKSFTVAFILGGTVLLLHLVGFLAAPMLAQLHETTRGDLLLTGSIAVGGAFTLFLSKAISEAVDALYQRGDLDLLLSSPIPMRRVLTTRLVAIAVVAGFLPILLIIPLVDGMVLRGEFVWAGAYPVLASLALTASAAGAGITFGLLAWIGPRWTRFGARALATLFGAASFLSTQAKFLMPDQARIALWDAMRPDLSPHGLQWWPARAVLGEPWPMAGLAVLGAGAVLLASTALGHVYGTGVLNTIAGSAGARGLRMAKRFRGGVFSALLRKEWLLLLRHPGLGAQVFYQFVFLVPGAIALMRMGVVVASPGSPGGNPGSMPGGVVFLTALMTGRIAKILVAGPYEGDHAAALAATSPVDARLLGRAKLLVTMGALAVIGGLPLVAIAWRLPHAFPAALLSCVGAASTRVWIGASGKKVLKKGGMKGRLSMTSDGLLGVIIDIGWGICGAVLSLFI
jgi:ABC-2 type transport system permease protein